MAAVAKIAFLVFSLFYLNGSMALSWHDESPSLFAACQYISNILQGKSAIQPPNNEYLLDVSEEIGWACSYKCEVGDTECSERHPGDIDNHLRLCLNDKECLSSARRTYAQALRKHKNSCFIVTREYCDTVKKEEEKLCVRRELEEYKDYCDELY